MTIDDVYQQLEDVRHELRDPRIGLMKTRALYRRLGELHQQIEDIEKDTTEHADND